jgi:Ca2+-binding EF-hand superfamily protein
LASGDLDGWLMALNGAIGAATGVAALAVAINTAAAAQAIFNALVAVNPYVAAAVAIAALSGAIYALRDETITLGDETTTVGATIRAAWEITTELTQSLWQSFTGWFAEATAGMGIDFQSATSFIKTAWTGGMDWLIDKATATVNGLISLFKAAGTTIGAIIAEIAIAWETRTAPSFDRLVGYLQENIKYEDHLANAGIKLTKTTQGLNEELQKKAGQITWLAQQEADYAELERDLAADQSRAAAQEKAMLALTKAQTEAKIGLTKATEGKAKARKGASAATKAATAAEREHKQALDDTNRAVQALIDRYLPARKAAEDYAEAEKAVAAALAGGPGSVALSAEEASTIMAGLAKDQAEAANKAKTESSAFSKAWERAVERIDDMFASMWKDLITGTGNTFDNIKDMLLNWLAEMAHALLTRPLVVSITTAMAPGAASAAGGTTGGMGGLGGIGSWLGGNSMGSGIASGLSNLGLGGSNASALGPMQPAGWLSGIANTPNWVLGGSAMLGGLAGSLLFGGKGYSGIGSTVGSTAGSIGGSALAGGLALTGPAGWALTALGGLLGGIGGGGLGSLFGNDEPRYGRLMASTGGRYKDLEDGKDGAYAKGSFGLNFGLSDQGSKNIDAMEYMEVYEGLAKVSDALANFYGPELAKKVEDELAKWPHIWGSKFEKGTAAALKAIVDAISDVAANTGDDIGVIFNRVLGELTGSAEEMAAQIEAAMQTTALLFESAKMMKDADLGAVLGLSADTGDAALQLLDYAKSIAIAGEATAVSVQRLLVNLTGLEQAALLTGGELAVTGQAFVDLSRELASAAEAAGGNMQSLIAQQTAYYQHFFSEEERAAVTRDQSLATIAKWNEAQGLTGAALVASSTGLRAYVEGLDLSTAAGQAAYVSAMAISGAFIILDQSLATLGGTIEGVGPAVEGMADRIADLQRRIADLQDPAGAQNRARLLELEQAIANQTPETAAQLRNLYQVLWELEDAAAAAAERASLIERLYAAAGDDAMVTQLKRQAELAAAVSDGGRALLLMIYAVEDANAAKIESDRLAEEAAQAAAEASRQAEEAAREAWNAAQDAAREAFDQRQEAAREQYDAIREIVGTLQTLRDALQSAIDAIYIDTPLTRVSLRAEAQEKITQALSAARGGTLPDLEALAPYLETVTQDASAQFKTLEEYQRNAYRTRADLVELERLAEDQQTTEELMLEALQTIIDESFPSAEYVSQDNTAALIANDNDNNAALTFDVERLIAIAEIIGEGVLRMDADMDGLITFAEMQAALVGIATDAELRALFNMLDTNGDGVLSALEAMPLKIAQNLSGMFDLLDANLDGLLTFDELKAGLGPLATNAQIRALMALMDENDDGIITKLEAMRYQLVSDSNILFAKMDTDSSRMLTKTEFMSGMAGRATDSVLQGFWNALDLNADQLLSATELIPFKIATNLSGYFNTLDQNTDGLLTYSELRTGLNGLATNSQIQQLIWAVDANGDGMIDQQEAATFKLASIDAEQKRQMEELHWLYETFYYTQKDYLNTKAVAQNLTGMSYATGGIAEGPLSGYGATLHGREAVIPLGDGNTVTAILQEPINRLGREAPDTAELRQALAELHAELKELRRDNQQIGASQIGELKEHNRRERKREVVPQQVEVVTP